MSEAPLLDVHDLQCLFGVRRSLTDLIGRRRHHIHAVDTVSFQVDRGEIVALVGESGCGKSTTGRLLLRLEDPTGGTVTFDGEDIFALEGAEVKQFRRQAQIIFQNPFEVFDPRQSIRSSLMQALEIHDIGDASGRESHIVGALERSGLTSASDFLDRFPHELSGGQAQRIATIRAMLLAPKFLVADEPVSMLDVSVRADILNQLLDIRERDGMAIVFITHDLSAARYVADRIAVMYLGMFVEIGAAGDVIDNPKHPYSQALLSHTLSIDEDADQREPLPIGGEVPTPLDLKPGCRFAGRCPYVFDRCKVETPALKRVEGTRQDVACHLYD